MSAHSTDVPGQALPWPQESATSLDQANFHVLYTTISQPLRAYLIGVTGHRDRADDLLQETLCRFLLRHPIAMPEQETRRYLFRIATNLLRDRWRRHDDLLAPATAQPHTEPSTTPDLDTRLDVHRVMHALKPRERELLWLAYVEGMSHAEIAAITSLRSLSVRLLLYRARAKAATLLAPRKASL